jgi:hypothetical protein
MFSMRPIVVLNQLFITFTPPVEITIQTPYFSINIHSSGKNTNLDLHENTRILFKTL